MTLMSKKFKQKKKSVFPSQFIEWLSILLCALWVLSFLFQQFIRLSFPFLFQFTLSIGSFFSYWWVYSSLPNLKILPLILFSSPISSRTSSRAHKKQLISIASAFSAPIFPSSSISDNKESRKSETYLLQHFSNW